ncbi:hypothetical protein DRP05_10865 [Archaeoglobales archaeon]|nr:MAG: hypothetical protein DRP05_10865 [Archaeoglobales archaeon]
MRVALYQMRDRKDIRLNINAAFSKITITKADFFCLPEYFPIPSDYKNSKTVEDAWVEVSLPTIEMLKEASTKFKGYIIGGSIVEKDEGKYYNTCFVFKDGEVIAKYRKINLVDDEVKLGLSRGKDTTGIKTEFGRVGILICADCLDNDIVEKVAKKNDIVFLPISLTDPSHPKVEGHPVSERIARQYNVTVVKVSRIIDNIGVKSAVVTPMAVYEAKSFGEELLVLDL